MSLIETNNSKDILKRESPWGSPSKNNKQPGPDNSSVDMEDLAKNFKMELKTYSAVHQKHQMRKNQSLFL